MFSPVIVIVVISPALWSQSMHAQFSIQAHTTSGAFSQCSSHLTITLPHELQPPLHSNILEIVGTFCLFKTSSPILPSTHYNWASIQHTTKIAPMPPNPLVTPLSSSYWPSQQPRTRLASLPLEAPSFLGIHNNPTLSQLSSTPLFLLQILKGPRVPGPLHFLVTQKKKI